MNKRSVVLTSIIVFLFAVAPASFTLSQQPATPQPAQDTPTGSSQQAQPRQEISLPEADLKEWDRIQGEFARNEQDYQLRRKAILKDFEAFLWRVKAQHKCPECGFDETKRVLVRPAPAPEPARKP